MTEGVDGMTMGWLCFGGIENMVVIHMRVSYVYILASKRNGTLYVGVTSDLVRRIWGHRNDVSDGFTKRYGVHTLVWYEEHETIQDAIEREKNIKEWKRAWKVELIESWNPSWRDLYADIVV